jgi:hypothetical protein
MIGSKWVKIGTFVIGIIIILTIIGYFGMDEILFTFQKADWLIIFYALIAHLVFLSLIGLRLKLLSGRYPPLSFRQSMKISIIGTTISSLTPLARLGGEPVKIQMLKNRYGVPKASAIVILDMFIEVLSLYAIIALAMFLIIIRGVLPMEILLPFLVLFIISFVLIVFFIIACTNIKWINRFVVFFKKIISKFKKVEDKNYGKMFRNAIDILLVNRRTLGLVITVSALTRILEFLRIWLIFLALGFEIPISIIVFGWSFVLLIGMIPWLPGGLGLVEAGGATAYILFGVTKGISVSFILVDRLFSFWLILLAGFIILHVSRTKISTDRERHYVLEKKHLEIIE